MDRESFASGQIDWRSALFENNPLPIVIHEELSGEIIDANSRALELFGLGAIGKCYTDFVSEGLFVNDPEVCILRRPGGEDIVRIASQRCEYLGSIARLSTITPAPSCIVRDEASAMEGCCFQWVEQGLLIAYAILSPSFEVVYQNALHEGALGKGESGKRCFEAFHKTDNNCPDCPVLKSFEDGMVHRMQRVLIIKGSPQDF